MREFKELIQDKIDKGCGMYKISKDSGVFGSTLSLLCQGKQVGVSSKTYNKLKEYLGEDFVINGNDPCDKGKAREVKKKMYKKPDVENLLRAMREADITKGQLATMSGIPAGNLYRMFSGEYRFTKFAKDSIAECLGADADELFGSEPMTQSFKQHKAKWTCTDCCYLVVGSNGGNVRVSCSHIKSNKKETISKGELLMTCPGKDEGWDEVVEWAEKVGLGKGVELD